MPSVAPQFTYHMRITDCVKHVVGQRIAESKRRLIDMLVLKLQVAQAQRVAELREETRDHTARAPNLAGRQAGVEMEEEQDHDETSPTPRHTC